jgi:hypothetical protein
MGLEIGSEWDGSRTRLGKIYRAPTDLGVCSVHGLFGWMGETVGELEAVV